MGKCCPATDCKQEGSEFQLVLIIFLLVTLGHAGFTCTIHCAFNFYHTLSCFSPIFHFSKGQHNQHPNLAHIHLN